jgi:hypothetical protein
VSLSLCLRIVLGSLPSDGRCRMRQGFGFEYLETVFALVTIFLFFRWAMHLDSSRYPLTDLTRTNKQGRVEP